MDDTQQRIERLYRVNPMALRLAELSCLAVRVEPALLRLLRHRFLPRADPSAELDLWFSELVQVRSAAALLVDLPVLARLRDALAADPLRDEVYQATLAYFAAHPARVRFEIALNALPVLDPEVDESPIERWLAPLLDELRGGGDAALKAARWLLQAAPRWHPRVRATAAAWAAVTAASALLGGRRVGAGAAPPGAVDRIAEALPPGELPTRPVGVAMTRRRLRLLDAGDGQAVVQVVATTPALLVLEVPGRPPQLISAEPGTGQPLPGVGSVLLRNLQGDGWRIQPPLRRRGAKRGQAVPSLLVRLRVEARWARGEPLELTMRRVGHEEQLVVEGDFETLLRHALEDSERPEVAASPWSMLKGPSWERALKAMDLADLIELQADDDSRWLPWEALTGPADAARRQRPIGLRLLRAPPPLPDDLPSRPVRDGRGLALIVTNPGPPSLAPLAELTREGLLIEQALKRRTKLEVQRLDHADFDVIVKTLLGRPAAIVHWASRGLVEGPPATPGMSPDEIFDRAGQAIEQLRRLPELVVLNLDASGFSPRHRESLRSGEHPVQTLLRRGVPMVVATGGRLDPAGASRFATRLYEQLLTGLSLREAVFAARESLREAFPGDATWRRYQVWGRADDRLSAARQTAPTADELPLDSVLEIHVEGRRSLGNTGFWAGDGLLVSTGLLATSDRWNADDGGQSWRLAVDEHDPDEPVIVARISEGPAPGPPLPLARGLPAGKSFEALLLSRSDQGLSTLAVRAEHDRRTGRLQLAAADDADRWPSTLGGAPLLVDGRCVGMVVTFDRVQDPPSVQAVAVGAIRRALQAAQRKQSQQRLQQQQQRIVQAVPGQDVISLQFDDAPELLLDPDDASGLLAPAAGDEKAPGGLGSMVLKSIEVLGVTGKPGTDALELEAVRRIDRQAEAGLYTPRSPGKPGFAEARRLLELPAGDGPVLVLLHGSLVDAATGFRGLWSGAGAGPLASFYAGRIAWLEFPTLSEGPLDLALRLARACAAGTRLHLLTHGGGGLAAEVLARFCAGAGALESALANWSDAPPTLHERLHHLAATVAERRLSVERMVRVAAPMRGVPLAARKLEMHLSFVLWAAQAQGIELPLVKQLAVEVARSRVDAGALPGLEPLRPDSPLLRWLDAPAPSLPGSLRVVAGRSRFGGLWSRLAGLLPGGEFLQDSDLVVPVDSMFGGAARAAGTLAMVLEGKDVGHFGYFGHERLAGAVADALMTDEPQGFEPVRDAAASR